MAFLDRGERMKRVIENLRSDAESIKRVKASTQAYKDGKTTTLTELKNYVQSHRPSGSRLGSGAPVAKMQAAQMEDPERVLEYVD